MSQPRWEVARLTVQSGVVEDVAALDELLAAGWEPFAVTPSPTVMLAFTYHLRRDSMLVWHDNDGTERYG